MLDHEVADPDGADPAFSEQGLEGSVRLERLVEGRWQRLMEDQEVDLLDAELGGTLLAAVQRRVVAIVADPDLGLEEHLRPVHVRPSHCFPDLVLFAVRRRRVDVAVATAERGKDAFSGLVRGRLEDAEAKRWHLDAVVQGHGLHVVHLLDVVGYEFAAPRRCTPFKDRGQVNVVEEPTAALSSGPRDC